MTGSERLGAMVVAVAQECLGEWQRQHEEAFAVEQERESGPEL
jgi:hypothetical protein